MPTAATLATDLGASSVYGEVATVPTGDYCVVTIEKQCIIRAQDGLGTAWPILYDLEILPSLTTGVPWFVSNFAFVMVGGVATAITFRLNNAGAGDGDYRVKATRKFSTVR